MNDNEFLKDLIFIKDVKLNTLYKIYFDPNREKLVITDTGKPMAFIGKRSLLDHMFVHKMKDIEWSPFSYENMKKEIDNIEITYIRDNRINKILENEI